jgi:hypothetical protein
MMPLLSEVKRLQGQQMGQSVQDYQPMEDKLFIRYQHLFLQLQKILKELMRVEAIRISDYLCVEMLYLVPQVLMVEVNFQSHQ